MKFPNKYLFLLFSFIFIISTSPAKAFWVWTPETNQWVNPKYAVKDTPSEQLQYGLGFYQNKQYKEAVREFRKLLKSYPKAREAADAQYHIGLCYEDQGILFQAFKEYQQVMQKYPFSSQGPDVVDKQYHIAEKILNGEQKKSGKLLDAVAGGKPDIVEIYETVIKNAPYGKYAAPSQYKIGLYFMGKKMYQEARDAFEKTINDYPDNEWAKAAKYQLALADSKRSTSPQYDQQITGEAKKEMEEFVKKFPDAELSDKAKKEISVLKEKEAENSYVIAEYYEKAKNYEAAKIYYQEILDQYPDTNWAIKALKRIRELGQGKK